MPKELKWETPKNRVMEGCLGAVKGALTVNEMENIPVLFWSNWRSLRSLPLKRGEKYLKGENTVTVGQFLTVIAGTSPLAKHPEGGQQQACEKDTCSGQDRVGVGAARGLLWEPPD